MSQEILLTVQSAATLNDFLRKELPKFLQGQNEGRADCVQGQNAACEKAALSNSKIRRLLFSGNVMVAASPERKVSHAQNGGKKASQAQNQRGGFFVCKNPAFSLKKNARVKVSLDQEKFFYEKQNDDIKFELDSSRVLYEDDAIIVVNKPPRFPTEATFAKDRDNLRAAVIRYLHKKIGLDKNPRYCGVIHRLDRDTSGVILFSKQRAANAALFAAFDSSEAGDAGEERAAKKIYVAVCERAGSYGLANGSGTAIDFKPKSAGAGPRLANNLRAAKDSKPKNAAASFGLSKDFVQGKNGAAPSGLESSLRIGSSFSVQNYLGRVSLKSQAAKWGFVPKEKGGKFARTDFKVLDEKDGRLFVQAELFTGRTHQIRVHLSQKGLPI
ncbi:MAG: hypothetical protein IJL24_07065 [Treponema sp.]|nr:hypothetical protein [Treponema sp.]